MKRLSGRLISAAAAAVFSMSAVFCALPHEVYAAEETSATNYYYQGTKEDASEYIEKGLEDYRSYIDISGFYLKFADLEEILTDILLDRPDLFYIEPEFEYASLKDGTLVTIKPHYYYSKSTLEIRRKKLDSAAKKIISGIDPAWTDIQKALFVHDKIAVTTTYNEQNDVRSAYEALVNGNGLCVAYAMAYKYIMDKIGVECETVINESINHCWNLVRIDGSWYHVDVTWDDTVPNFEGLVYHDYFMVSDKAVQSGRSPHTGGASGFKASDTSYDEMFWHSSAARIIPDEDTGLWYYVDNKTGNLCCYDWNKTSSYPLKSIGMSWYTDSTRTKCWLYCYSRLEKSGSSLYYNSAQAIYMYDIKSGQSMRLRTYALSGSTSIYGLSSSSGRLVFNTADSPTDKKFSSYSAFPLEGSAVILDPPKNIISDIISENGSYTVNLSWTPSAGADGYYVYSFDPDTRKAELIGTAESPSYKDSGLSKGQYLYVIRAYKKTDSAYSYSNYSVVVSQTAA